MKQEMFLWGKHPSYCNGAYLKLSDNTSRCYYEQKKKEGWKDLIYQLKGTHPDDSEYQDWFGVIKRSRDSDVLEECNSGAKNPSLLNLMAES